MLFQKFLFVSFKIFVSRLRLYMWNRSPVCWSFSFRFCVVHCTCLRILPQRNFTSKLLSAVFKTDPTNTCWKLLFLKCFDIYQSGADLEANSKNSIVLLCFLFAIAVPRIAAAWDETFNSPRHCSFVATMIWNIKKKPFVLRARVISTELGVTIARKVLPRKEWKFSKWILLKEI